jgi:multidrug resistance efflux pump
VKAGTSLYQIDASTYQAEYASAKAMLEKAEEAEQVERASYRMRVSRLSRESREAE